MALKKNEIVAYFTDENEAWRSTQEPRWDEGFESLSPDAAQDVARSHLREFKMQIGGFECALDSDNRPDQRAKSRERHAARYYDLHRMGRLASASPTEVREIARLHVETAAIAEDLAGRRPASLRQFRAEYGAAIPAQISREYFLWRHSLDLVKFAPVTAPSKVIVRDPSVEEVLAIDEALEASYDRLTRSNIRARLAVADTAGDRSALGITDRETGDMMIPWFPASRAAASARNAKILVEQMARSMLARHFWNERNAFNKWLLGPGPQPPIAFVGNGIVFRGPVGPALHLRSLTGENGVRTDYTDELANAMANALFDVPSMPLKSRLAPTRQAVFYASALFKRKPLAPASYFRSLSRDELRRQRLLHGPVIMRDSVTYSLAAPCHPAETLTWNVPFSELRDNFTVFGSTAKIKTCPAAGCTLRYAGTNGGGRHFRILPVPTGTAEAEIFRRLRAELRDAEVATPW